MNPEEIWLNPVINWISLDHGIYDINPPNGGFYHFR